MFLLARMHRRRSSKVARVLMLLLGGAVFGCSIALVWVVCSNPLELEVREGSIWLHVLASRAGVDIYDPFEVAFVNMAHGPLDGILKTWISRCLPLLPGHYVTRAFVLITPLVLLGTAYSMLRKLSSALLAAGALHLLLTSTSLLLFVGRSDSTAICGVCLAGVLTHQLLESPHWAWSERPYLLRQLGLGAASAIVALTLWRYLPAVLAFLFVVLAARVARCWPRHVPTPACRWLGHRVRRAFLFMVLAARAARCWPRHVPAPACRWLGHRVRFALEEVIMGSVLFLAGFALIWLPTFLIELHGDFTSYYDHFFGFFTAKSGWGTFPGAQFELFPRSLLEARLEPLSVFVLLLVLGCYRLRKQRLELAAWIAMLLLMWGALAYGYFRNAGAGGLHYFFEYFVFAWVFMLHALGKRHPWGVPIRLLIFEAVLIALPWQALFEDYELAHERRSQARNFLHEVARVTHGEPIFGESTHLFKTSYRGELVDSGDTVHAIAASGYFGSIFGYTYQRYVDQLQRSPPRFVMAAVLVERPFRGITTPTLRNLLVTRYRRVLIARHSAFALSGSQALFERLPSAGKARPPAR